MARDGMRALGFSGVVAVFLLMTIGNVVSATGSGLACPDWPLCHGRLLPPFRADALIEYGHRVTALAASILVIAASAAAIRRTRAPGARRVAIILLVLLGVQVALGGITVLLRLPHLISTAHLVNALLILAGLLLLTAAADSRHGPRPFVPKMARLVRVGLLVLLCQLALGGYVRHSGAGLACPDFPLCSGQMLPDHWLAIVHWVHRWLGVTLLGLFIHIAMAARRTPSVGVAALTAALGVLQVGLGICAVLFRLDPAVRALHASIGYALWALLVWLSVGAGTWASVLAPIPDRPQQSVQIAHA